ncbi:MAG: LysE family transporter [Candidatus Baldrarchaeia archaeon]
MRVLPAGFIVKVIAITSSGALSPGPLTASTIGVGTKDGWKSGFMVSVGHTIVEFPLTLLIALGLISFMNVLYVRTVVSLAGGGILLLLAYLMGRDIFAPEISESGSMGIKIESPLAVGVLLSAFNPHFIVWWIFVGGSLVIEAYTYTGMYGVVLMYIFHVWMDYAFLMAVAHASFKGREILKSKGYKVLLGIIVAVLVIFGVDLIFYGLTGSRILPL